MPAAKWGMMMAVAAAAAEGLMVVVAATALIAASVSHYPSFLSTHRECFIA